MKWLSLLTISFICVWQNNAYGFTIDTALKRKLDTILVYDQRYRQAMVLQPGKERDSMAKALGITPDAVNDHFGDVQNKLDSINLVVVEEIFRTSGYPGKSKVGVPTNEAAYNVIQHTGKIRQYFPLIEKAGKAGEISHLLVAMMQDRMLKEQGREQIYGTQYAGYPVKDPVTGEQKIKWFLWPVKDYIHVAQRRKKAGFKETIAADAASQGTEPQMMTLAEIKVKCPWLLPQK